MQYKVVKQIFGFDQSKTEKYVVKSVTGEMLEFNKVRNQVTQMCGIHRGTVNLVIDGLLDVLVNNLDMGHSVQLGEFGVLRPGFRTKAQDTKEDANADAVYRRKINFVPGKMLKNFLKDVSITRASFDKDSEKANEGNNTNPGNGDGSGGDEFIDPSA
ncbi:DNA-binding protein [Bacteroides sp. 224]|uniref:HU family DNA-binding protein n=1 Tax=Bacteroides sp. 224 TaxID=2302936 RepID=UPI001EF1AACC|nr:DNA-binding protein [Bacteroides sp. 224]